MPKVMQAVLCGARFSTSEMQGHYDYFSLMASEPHVSVWGLGLGGLVAGDLCTLRVQVPK